VAVKLVCICLRACQINSSDLLPRLKVPVVLVKSESCFFLFAIGLEFLGFSCYKYMSEPDIEEVVVVK